MREEEDMLLGEDEPFERSTDNRERRGGERHVNMEQWEGE